MIRKQPPRKYNIRFIKFISEESTTQPSISVRAQFVETIRLILCLAFESHQQYHLLIGMS